jgi:O-glycosyl hydrolase
MFFTTNSGIGEAEDGTPFPYTGIGLTLLRTRIAPDGTTRETDIMQMARDRGARVWSAPWSPPIAFKDSGTLNGGRFVSRPEHHTAYANQLADYVAAMRDESGVDLYALSMQNEPNISEVYESCEWTSRQIRAFVPYLRAALDARGAAGTRLLLPESFNWQFAEAADTLDDPVTAAMVDILAAHGYGSSAAAVDARGKALWMTEDSLLEGSDSSMDNGLYWAGRIHDFLTVAEVNAWHYWWLISGNEDGNEGLADSNGVPAKRMYALGQFSRFVRPGSYRMGTSASDGGVRVSAYRHLFTGAFAVVAINTNDTEVALTATLDGASAPTVTPWITSASMSLSNQPPVAVVNSVFTHTLPARSVVTYAGHGPADTPLSAPGRIARSRGRVRGPGGRSRRPRVFTHDFREPGAVDPGVVHQRPDPADRADRYQSVPRPPPRLPDRTSTLSSRVIKTIRIRIAWVSLLTYDNRADLFSFQVVPIGFGFNLQSLAGQSRLNGIWRTTMRKRSMALAAVAICSIGSVGWAGMVGILRARSTQAGWSRAAPPGKSRRTGHPRGPPR